MPKFFVRWLERSQISVSYETSGEEDEESYVEIRREGPTSCIIITDKSFAEYDTKTQVVVIPTDIVSIPDDLFSQHNALIKVVLPEFLTRIGNEAFYQCVSLVSIYLPRNLVEIGKGAFRHCSKLLFDPIILPLRVIGKGAFESCENLYEIRLGDSNVTTI